MSNKSNPREELPPPLYNSKEAYQMADKKSRMPQWFREWRANEFYHLKVEVGRNTKLLWIVLGGLIVAALLDRLVG